MTKRIISGIGFIIVVVGFFVLRQYVCPYAFQILTWFIGAVGTFEMARAMKGYTSNAAFITATVFGALLVPAYCLTEYLLFPTYGWAGALVLIGAFALIILIESLILKTGGKSILLGIAPLLYPAVFVLVMALMNDLENGFVALLLTYVIAPAADTFAFLTGSVIGGPKLCPKLSPKKTWSGALGGTVGGVIGSILVGVIFPIEINFSIPVLLFAIIGLVGSILTIAGDLFESFIKRKVGIKDMGNIMPGHGGMLDRFDGSFFAGVLVYLIFLFI